MSPVRPPLSLEARASHIAIFNLWSKSNEDAQVVTHFHFMLQKG